MVPNVRHGNHGGIGNMLDRPRGIAETYLPIPNAAEWELKALRIKSTSLMTLFHIESPPRAIRLVHGGARSDRGIIVMVNRQQRKGADLVRFSMRCRP